MYSHKYLTVNGKKIKNCCGVPSEVFVFLLNRKGKKVYWDEIQTKIQLTQDCKTLSYFKTRIMPRVEDLLIRNDLNMEIKFYPAFFAWKLDDKAA